MLLVVITALDLGFFVSALRNQTRYAIVHAPLAETRVDRPRLNGAAAGLSPRPRTAGGGLRAASLGDVLDVHFIRHFVPDGRAARRPRGGLSQRKLRAALDVIEEHLDTAVTVRDCAAVLHLSPCHFARTSPASTGLPPHRSVVTRRVERAMPSPRGGDDLARAQVAARSGSRDQGHFTRPFQRLVGGTPERFR
jgi:AraC family transcriptional regulator